MSWILVFLLISLKFKRLTSNSNYYQANGNVQLSDNCLGESSKYEEQSAIQCILRCQVKSLKSFIDRKTCYCIDEKCSSEMTNLSQNKGILYSPPFGRWTKTSPSLSCYGSKSDKFASFTLPKTGKIKAIKMQHESGYVSCDSKINSKSYWGCRGAWGSQKGCTIITDETNKSHFPMTGYSGSKYDIKDDFSRELIIQAPNDVPYYGKKDKTMRIWYCEDLLDKSEDDNDDGLHCVYVFVLYE